MVGLVGSRGGGGGECLARRLAHRHDRAAADWARHELAELVKVDCEGAGVREKKDHRWSGGEVERSRGEVASWFGGQVVRWSGGSVARCKQAARLPRGRGVAGVRRGGLTGAVVVQIELRYEIGHLVIGHLVSK